MNKRYGIISIATVVLILTATFAFIYYNFIKKSNFLNQEIETLQVQKFTPGSADKINNSSQEVKNNPQNTQSPEEKKMPDYVNEEFGISFNFLSIPKDSKVKEENGKLYAFYWDNYKNNYTKWEQDVLEIFKKDKTETLENAVRKLILKQGADLSKCNIEVIEKENRQIIRISYKVSHEHNEKICSASEGPGCWVPQVEKYSKIASEFCSDFIAYPYDNHFIYQPQNALDKIVFVRHITGQDAGPWDPSTITLFNAK